MTISIPALLRLVRQLAALAPTAPRGWIASSLRGRAPLRRFVHAAGHAADAEHAQAVRSGRQHSRGACVDSHQVVGVEWQAGPADAYRARAAQCDGELLLS